MNSMTPKPTDTTPTTATFKPIKIGLLSVSDRAYSGTYEDKGLPALKKWLKKALKNPIEFIEAILPDEKPLIEAKLKELADQEKCPLIFTTGGTGPAPRDVTPEATLAVADRLMPGFGEQMRQISLNFVPTAILSRQEGVIRGQSLIVNLPGQPKAIAEILGGLTATKERRKVDGIFASIPLCIQLLEGPYLETNPDICQAFRPKSHQRT